MKSRIVASDGMDTLDATILDFMFIRPLPWPIIFAFAGIIVAGIAIWVYRKRRKGEPILKYKEQQDSDGWRKLTREEIERLRKEEEERERRQKEEDEKFDPKEFFGV
jgi:LPXTG-motif cell wall-anchored protein